MNTRTAIATLALLTAATTAGCTSSEPQQAAKPSATPTANPGDQFMDAVINAHLDSYARGIPAADELKAFPPRWCEALDSGHSVKWMLDIFEGGLYPVGEEWGTAKADANELVVIGVKTHCPKHQAAVLAELRSSGQY